IECLQILAVIFQRFRVGLPRPLWIAKARDGTEVAVGGSGALAILLKPRSVRPHARRLFFCYGSEQGLSVLRLIRLQQVERLLQPLVSLCRSLLSVRDGIAQRLRRAGGCLRRADPEQALNDLGLELLVSCLFTGQPVLLARLLDRDLPLMFPNQESRHQRKHGKDGNDRCRYLEPPILRDHLALPDVVGWDPEYPRNHLRQRQISPIAALTHVSRKEVCRLVRDRPVGRHLEPERRREALGRRVAGLAVQNYGDYRPVSVAVLEKPQFLVDVMALGRIRRAKGDQDGRGIQRGEGLLAQRIAFGGNVPVAEDRP